MFEKIRKPGKTLINTLIFGLICVVFVFIGGPFSGQTLSGGSALTVNKQAVSLAEYQTYLNILQSRAGGEDPEILKKQVISTLLTGELIRQSAHKVKMVVSAKEKRDVILNLDFLKEDGRWTQSRYRNFLKSQRLSPAQFEKRVKKDLLNQHFQALFNHAFHLPLGEEQKEKKLKSFKSQVSYVKFSSTKLSNEDFLKLEELVQGESPALLDLFVKEKVGGWKDTGVFYLDRTHLPDLKPYKDLLDELWSFWPKTGLIKRVIPIKDQSFILRVGSFSSVPLEKTEKKPLFSQDSFFAQILGGRTLFLSWLTAQKKQAQVEVNPRIAPAP